jgi:histone acetyltransferase (RNA polymerase elongator complex component)
VKRLREYVHRKYRESITPAGKITSTVIEKTEADGRRLFFKESDPGQLMILSFIANRKRSEFVFRSNSSMILYL